jgi:hypothetical protein
VSKQDRVSKQDQKKYEAAWERLQKMFPYGSIGPLPKEFRAR